MRGVSRHWTACLLAAAVLVVAAAGTGEDGSAVGTTDAPPSPLRENCVFDTWGRFLFHEPQVVERQDRIAVPDDRKIAGIVFGPLAGDLAKLYQFMLIRDGCIHSVVSVGSYAITNDSARQSGTVGPEGRIYHMDLYLPDSQQLLGFFTEPPSYDEALSIALEHLK